MVMEFLQDRRVVIGGGVALALVAGVALAVLWGAGDDRPAAPPPASQGGLMVEVGREEVKLDPSRKLPCYVDAVSIGMTTLGECASRNGVASGQLDVGIDQTGALAFGDVGAVLTPLPPEDNLLAPVLPAPAAVINEPAPVAVAETRGPVATCWRYADRNWVRLSDVPLSACVTTLFEGRCERPGAAAYGRWGEQTLRLVPGRVEQSPDNRNFRTLVDQSANCSLGPVG